MFRTFSHSGEGEVAIVYLPSIEGSGALASHFLRKAESLFPITRLHYPGHSRLTLEELADGCVAALTEQGHTGAIWLGDSFGTAVALTIGLRHPRATRGLVLAGGGSKASYPSTLLLSARLWEMMPDSWRRAFLRHRLHRLARRTSSHIPRSCHEEFVTNAQMEFIAWRMRLLAGFDVRNQIARIDAPVLYLAGEDDRLVNTQEEARVFRERVAESRTFLFPGCGHAVLAERPFECIELIDLFVPMAKRAAA